MFVGEIELSSRFVSLRLLIVWWRLREIYESKRKKKKDVFEYERLRQKKKRKT